MIKRVDQDEGNREKYRYVYAPPGAKPFMETEDMKFKYYCDYPPHLQLSDWLNRGPRQIHSEYWRARHYYPAYPFWLTGLDWLLTKVEFSIVRNGFREEPLKRLAARLRCKYIRAKRRRMTQDVIRRYKIPEFRYLICFRVWRDWPAEANPNVTRRCAQKENDDCRDKINPAQRGS